MAGVGSGLRIAALRREGVAGVAHQLGSLYHDGFGGKRCCLCFFEGEASTQRNVLKAYSVFPDSKLQACGIALDEDGNAVGLAQMGFHDTPGDWELPQCCQDKVHPGTCELERLVVGTKARGKGLGKKLLNWVDDQARQRDCQFVELRVVSGNPAKKLYLKEGYVPADSCCSKCCMCPIIFCLMGHVTAEKMRKDLRSPKT